MLSKGIANHLHYTLARREVCVHYPTAINVLHTVNRFSGILPLMTCSTENRPCVPGSHLKTSGPKALPSGRRNPVINAKINET
ncbi:hypothetical protein AVEN_264677-1 [Araneus ventricosus]|uniref:Uncharacterized protein n=1 Tax=Araneus ventricosus TaxID=182803 RepID=A0A4Y2SGK9_ARAVE|nr:hypothetical protein AVEN_146022-1 [Araneus ventricosus]GBN87372.1 hypothetical protein AVEN_173739-1 [Araneus ventricosus]GBN89773.1 hypothetical protein AVEN_58884-1 [Araneus ventricosus]GBN89793.1 hypothetical protein AVEN_264677-1 [Araneus ventricosus]